MTFIEKCCQLPGYDPPPLANGWGGYNQGWVDQVIIISTFVKEI